MLASRSQSGSGTGRHRGRITMQRQTRAKHAKAPHAGANVVSGGHGRGRHVARPKQKGHCGPDVQMRQQWTQKSRIETCDILIQNKKSLLEDYEIFAAADGG
jgi:hypothetical protein